MPVVVKNDDDDDNDDVQFLFVRSPAAAVTNVTPPLKKRARLNPFNVLKAAPHDYTTTSQEEDDGVLLPWMTCNVETKSPYLLDLLDCIRTTQVFGPLWTKHEADLISIFLKLSIPTQDFFIRLCYRKLLWHRLLGVVNLARKIILIDDAAAAASGETNHFDFELKNEGEDLSSRFQVMRMHSHQ